MYVLFEAAVENDILGQNPVKKSVKVPPGRKAKEKRVLSVEEQKNFWIPLTV